MSIIRLVCCAVLNRCFSRTPKIKLKGTGTMIVEMLRWALFAIHLLHSCLLIFSICQSHWMVLILVGINSQKLSLEITLMFTFHLQRNLVVKCKLSCKWSTTFHWYLSSLFIVRFNVCHIANIPSTYSPVNLFLYYFFLDHVFTELYYLTDLNLFKN